MFINLEADKAVRSVAHFGGGEALYRRLPPRSDRVERFGVAQVLKGWAKQGLSDEENLLRGFQCFDASQSPHLWLVCVHSHNEPSPEPSMACRPFDRGRDGFVMGEGAASLVLEEYQQARSRDAHIYCEVVGYSLNNNAFHMTTPLPTGESCVQAMTNALASAKVCPELIDYINAHAISIPVLSDGRFPQ